MEEIQGPDLPPALHDKVSSTIWRTWRKSRDQIYILLSMIRSAQTTLENNREIQGPDLVPALQNRDISETVFINFSGALESIPRNRFRQPM
jgi:hypothetical protein